jgi:hypothetical protein
MDFIDRAIKGIKITAVVLITLVVLAGLYGAYENCRYVKNFVLQPVTGEEETYVEWLDEYNNDIALQEQWQRDFAESKARLEKLGVEFDEEVNNGTTK